MQNAEKLSITLTSEMVRTIKESVESGEYASTSEVLRDAFRIWQRAREEHAERMAAIKARIESAVHSTGPRYTSEEVRAHLAATKPNLVEELFE
jgi:antitoxin ParD1/3/4